MSDTAASAPAVDHPRTDDWLRQRHAALAHIRRLQAVCRNRMGTGDPDWLDVFEHLSALHSTLFLDYTNVAVGRDVRDLPDGWIEPDLAGTDYYQAQQRAIRYGATDSDEY
ncbi:hypothetical protein [Amycolatopsis methanolica]|uniref:hypothetical protein n=1 Tax=Amycolatopsis methanolica TaxID=1814 RepID=UPI0034210B4A